MLSGMLDELSEKQQLDVIFCIMSDFGGKEPQAFADDYFDYNGYGENDDGIIFAVDMDRRKWAISTFGYGMEAFTDYAQSYLIDEIIPYLGNGDYFTCCAVYAELCDDIITQAKEGKPLDDNGGHGTKFWVGWIFGAVAIGFVLALLYANIKKSKLKSVRTQDSAGSYTRPGSMQLWCNEDRFAGSHVSKRRLQTESSSGRGSGGGSSTHKSSTGRSHGGSSGSF